MRTISKIFWIFFALLSPLFPIYLYFDGNWYSILHSFSLGMLFGIISYIYFLNALIISARIPYFDRLYGHDRVLLFHGYLALTASVFAFAHIYFKRIYFPKTNFQINLGITATVIFLSIIITTLLFMVTTRIHLLKPVERFRIFFTKRLKLDYSFLKAFHNLTALAVIILTAHVMLASPTNETYQRLGIMGVWSLIAITGYVYHKFIRLFIMSRKALKITRVNSLNDSVVEIEMRPEKGREIKHKAGQFGYFRILSKMCGSDEHPFTISSPPQSSELTITVKNLGDYTAKLDKLETGAKVLFDGPYGVFSPVQDTAPMLFVAGGIGITPFLSILSHWGNATVKSPVTLVWSVRYEEDLIHREFFRSAERDIKNFSFVPIVTSQKDRSGEEKRINQKLFSELISQPENTSAYICGPDTMRIAAVKALRKNGVKGSNIHFEKFSL
ncbi:oxidoreductase FAD/NAD(P)-binding domain-containing protein otein [Chitinispirillum alkaliphilum]|nr:oxidoreductase FAD/NAD(P)-binding domain-containing protein otein [Chitinispirillum alkaliphilum]